MQSIAVSHLTKSFNVSQKEPGIRGTISSLFNRKYRTITAVKDVSFSIEEGEFIGFIGPNGAGKTTTLKCLSGLLYPNSGKVSVLGFTPFERNHDYLKQISLVMGQKNQLWWDLPAMETFLLNKEIYGVTNNHFDERLSELSELLDAKDQINIPVKGLSLGQRMKMELIAALLHSPKVLFLDEPTIGLDVLMQQKIRDFLKEYNIRHNATIILTSHYMADVEALCKRVIIINFGTIIFDGLLSDLVKKFAPYKRISIYFEEKIPEETLIKFGKIESYTFPKVVLRVGKNDTNKIASEILKRFAVRDVGIEEPEIEEVIREVFSHDKKRD